jgi:hypothetical protein
LAVQLSPERRDALFKLVLAELSEFEDLRQAVEAGDLEQSYRLGRRMADGLRLIVDGGLGWAHRTAEPVTLVLPPEELRRIMTRMRDTAAAEYESMGPEREEAEGDWRTLTDAQDACTAVLGQIA